MDVRRLLALCSSLLMALVMATACGGDEDKGKDDDSGGKETSGVSTPTPLEQDGEFLFCTDVPYPPAETQVNGEFEGYEIDIAREVAKRLGTKGEFQKTGFDGIIGALNAKKCDAIISSMNSTEERKKEVDFVDYMSVGQSLLVGKDLEDEVSELADLSGKSVAVQVGTTLREAIEAENKTLEGDGEDPIDVKTFPDAGAAASALQTDDVDAFFTDSPVAAEYVNKDPDTFAFGGEPVDPLPVGIAIRKDDGELLDAVQQAIDDMYEDGAMGDILDKWKVSSFALEGEDGSDAGSAGEGGTDTSAETTDTTTG